MKTTIVVNGTPVPVTTRTVTYEAIARMSGHPQPSVTYRFSNTGEAGMLHAGDRIAVGTDLTISAYSTTDA